MTFRFADKLVFGLLFLAAFLLMVSLVLFQHGQTLAFYILSITLLGSASGVVLMRDVVRSAFLMALSFVCIGGLFVTLHADFLAAAQILIYAGAISILFVFGIMLTRKGGKYFPVMGSNFNFTSGVFIFFGLFLLLAQVVFPDIRNLGSVQGSWNTAGVTTSPDLNTVAFIGEKFFSQYLLPFEIASVVLLMALIGAIVLAKKEEGALHE